MKIMKLNNNNNDNSLCGYTFCYPKWLQKFANQRIFLVVYGFLGTIQAMASLYFIITLTTLEKRFKIPSQTTGFIISGNEISQILLSLILSYYGGQRNRPKWIGIGVVFCGVSCLMLASLHFLYGAGEDSLRLTKEYNATENIDLSFINATAATINKSINGLCLAAPTKDNCDELLSIFPLVLIFLSQFVLGIGNTLYYALGQTYLDDNTKRKNTPMLIAYALSMRMLGPVIAFVFGALILRIYIDPTKTPVIDRQDPRWLGAYWIGWIFMAFAMFIFAGLISLFPIKMNPPTIKPTSEDTEEESFSLENDRDRTLRIEKLNEISIIEVPKLKDFSTALMRLLKNKVLMFNIISTVFYILGTSGYMTYIVRYMEVQFSKSASDSTILTGPLILIGVLTGFLSSGFVISKYKPNISYLLIWNIIAGIIFMMGQFSFIFLSCSNESLQFVNSGINLTTDCNRNCACDKVQYNPVCDKKTLTTYFSPCHAGCNEWNSNNHTYFECQCSKNEIRMKPVKVIHSVHEGGVFEYDANPTIPWNNTISLTHRIMPEKKMNFFASGPCLEGCGISFMLFGLIFFVINTFGSSGKITNILLNFRCVAKKDKSFSQGLVLMLISLLALIPGPIIFGKLIDSSCLIWNTKCNTTGNCQLYDQKLFRFYINACAMGFTSVAVFFDALVWHYGKHVDIYAEDLVQNSN